ncbi:MAG: hypothetical protein II973_02025 [Spirochaetaceae bacterium]|nr:hypothetical protein [Spirochaetaceae bacterium]
MDCFASLAMTNHALAMTGKLLAMTNLAPTLTDFEFALMWIASSLRSSQ